MKLLLDRSQYDENGLLGDLYVDGVWECVVLENSAYAIPEGRYEVLITWSPKFKQKLPLIINVPARDGIRIHCGNFASESAGCLLTGESATTKAGLPFILHSKRAFDRLMPKLEETISRGDRVFIEVVK